MSLVLCRRCLGRVRPLDYAPSATSSPLCLMPRRGLKPTRSSAPPGSTPTGASSGGAARPKWFVRRLAELPEAPLLPQALPASTSAWRQLAARVAGAVVTGGLLCVAVVERRRGDAGMGSSRRLLPFDFGYVDTDAEDGNIRGLARDLPRVAPCTSFCLVAVLLGNLLRSRRLSAGVLTTACRHVLDRPGRSSLATAPWLSSLCVFHGWEFLFTGGALAALSLLNFGLSPAEKILAFLAGAWTGSAARCAYQMLPAAAAASSSPTRRFAHWRGAHAGLAALAGLLVLGMHRDAVRAQTAAAVTSDADAAAAADINSMPRSARRVLLELQPGLCLGILAGWAAVELGCLLLLRRRRLPAAAAAASAETLLTVPPALQHVSSLAGLAAACGLHACLEWRLAAADAAAAVPAVAVTAAAAAAASSGSTVPAPARA